MTLELKQRKLIDKLMSLPESGMGYQIADITLSNGRVIKKISIYNAQTIILPEGENFSESDIAEITLSA